METIIATTILESIGKRLYNLFEDVVKGFKMDNDVNLTKITSHFKRYLNDMVEKYSYINTLVLRNNRKKLIDLYQPLTISIKDDGKLREEKIVGYPNNLLNEYPKLLITDTAGMGKSTMSRRMYLDVIYNNYGIPLFIELRRISEKHTIFQDILEQVSGLNKEFDFVLLKELLKKGGFIIFLDGYDEIPSKNKSFVTDNIQQLVDNAPRNKYVITSRPEDGLAYFGAFQKARIKPLEKREAYELLRRYDGNGEVSKRLIDILDTGAFESISEFLKNPLLTSLLFIAFEYKQTIPLRKHIFYAQVIDAYFQSHDLTKGGGYMHEKKSGLDVDDFNKIMRRIGYECMRIQQVEFDKNEFLEIIEKAKSAYPTIEFKASDLFEDLEHSVPLFCVDGVLHRWVHKSIQEYYASMYLSRDLNDIKGKVLDTIYNSEKILSYYNVLDLFSDIDNNSFILHFLNPTLSKYVNFYNEKYHEVAGIPRNLIEERIYILFETQIGIAVMVEKPEKIPNLFSLLRDKFISQFGINADSAVYDLKNKCCLSIMSPSKKIHKLFIDKYPELFNKCERLKEIVELPEMEFTPINSVDQFSTSVYEYHKVNDISQSSTYRFYMNIDEARKKLKWINSNVSEMDSSDIISGL